MLNQIRSRVDYFVFPLEPDAEAVLTLWKQGHRTEFTHLRMRFVKLRLAISAQHPSTEAEALKHALALSERRLLAALDEVFYTVIPTLKAGYGSPSIITAYHEAVKACLEVSAMYKQLRSRFEEFLDA